MPQCRSQNITVGGAVGERYLTFQRQRLNLRRCNRRGLPFTQLYRDRIAVAIATDMDLAASPPRGRPYIGLRMGPAWIRNEELPGVCGSSS